MYTYQPSSHPAMPILETPRLILRELTPDDAPFMFELMNDPAWLEFIGDRGIRTVDDAREYIARGPMAMYRRYGYGSWLVERKADGTPVGTCGILRRDGLDDPDLGFAFLPAARGQGYASEAGAATMVHARGVLGLGRIVAIATRANRASGRVLTRLGFRLEGGVTLPGDPEALDLYASNA